MADMVISGRIEGVFLGIRDEYNFPDQKTGEVVEIEPAVQIAAPLAPDGGQVIYAIKKSRFTEVADKGLDLAKLQAYERLVIEGEAVLRDGTWGDGRAKRSYFQPLRIALAVKSQQPNGATA